MGQRYEKSKKNVSDNKQTLERLRTDKDTLQSEYAPLSILDSIQGLLDDEASDAIHEVRTVGEYESQRLKSETYTAEEEKKQITGEINQEIAKLNAGLEKLRRAGGLEFGKKAVEQSSLEYKKQIDKFKALIGELGESNGGGLDIGGSADGAQASFVNEGQGFYKEQGTPSDVPSFDNPFSSGLNSTMAAYPTISGSHSIEDDLIATNPNYSHTDPDSPWNNNCQRCVSAYEARRRGFDVEAQPIPSGMDSLPIMRHPNGWPSVYEGAELIDCSANSGTGAAINIESQMEEWGSDARAIVRVRWKPENGGGGHVFIAERTNGTTRFIDPQNGETDAKSYFDFAKGSEVFCMRIDNLPFSERIHQCCSSRAA
ncbi:MAG: toxin glutamine deamidase domain-containing protein [Eubacterium sp.]|nr:toxin glutamine deamidase domain-containing protein [Eubacterium sp.]